jgi:ankyrin repeat protein
MSLPVQDINAREPVGGYSALHEASEHGHLAMCTLLFRSGEACRVIRA